MNVDKMILGDNQFFGVNHISEDKGRLTYERFKDIEEIRKIMYYSLDNGVTGVMFSTHPAIYEITDMMRKDPVLRNGFSIYVNVPYIVKYVRMVSTMGVARTIETMLCDKNFFGRIKYMAQTAVCALKNDYLGIANKLIDVEMAPFHGLNVKAVFLHNVLTDLALGYDMKNVISSFDKHIRSSYGIMPSYITFNLPGLCCLLDECGIRNSLIMTSVNKKGFLMSPGRALCEDAIRKTEHEIIAMATLASGALKPEEAYEYVFSIGNIQSVIVGVSTKEHAEETFKILRRHLS